MSVATALMMRKRMIINRLREHGAFSEESALTLSQAGVFNPNAFPFLTKRMVKLKIITQTNDGRYYLNKST